MVSFSCIESLEGSCTLCKKGFVELVRNKLSSLSGESYVVVRGPKGAGKTCIVDSVLENRPGILRFDIPPATTYREIMNDVFTAVSGNSGPLQAQKSRAKDILKWHNRFYANDPFVIAFHVMERFPPSIYADIGSVSRYLGAFDFKCLLMRQIMLWLTRKLNGKSTSILTLWIIMYCSAFRNLKTFITGLKNAT
jgi:hypothetical protein